MGDLSGHLDSWVLEGNEDLTSETISNGLRLTNGNAKATEASSDSEDEDSEGDERHPTIIHGQHWLHIHNRLPKLPTAPLFLSFRPALEQASDAHSKNNVAVHPTRHNPTAHSHELPQSDARLVALTADHQLLEFNVLQGGLTEWSRRNPPSSLPNDFTRIRDRALGALWDTDGGKERLWLYGHSWLFMFDMTRDLPKTASSEAIDESSKAKAKARMEALQRSEEELQRNTSGAGSKRKQSELATGIGNRFKKIRGVNIEKAEWVSMEAARTLDSDGDDDDIAGVEFTALTKSRRGETDDDAANGQLEDGHLENGEAANGVTTVAKVSDDGPNWWFTMKYRPILGIVPLGGGENGEEEEEEEEEEGGNGLEVALIERPMWDVELPPRYFGEHEK